MLSYVDRSVFRAKLAEKGDPQMMDPKYKDVSVDFLRRANEDYGLHRVAIGDPVGNGAEAINLKRFAKEHMLAYLAVIDPDETIPRDTDRVMTFEAGVLLGVIQTFFEHEMKMKLKNEAAAQPWLAISTQ